MTRSPWRRETMVAAVLSVPLALLFTWTQVFPLNGIPVLGTDYGQLVWNMWSVDRAISSGESPLHSDIVFDPIGTSLAAHVLTPGFFPVTATVKLWRRVLGSFDGPEDLLYPMVAYKLAIGLSYAVIAFATYAFLRRIGASRLASLAVTIAYAFSAFNQLHAPHLNHLSTAAILPLSAWSLVSLWEKPRLFPVIAIALLFGGGPYFGELIVFVWVTFLAIGAVTLARGETRAQVASRLSALGGARIAAAFVIAVVMVSPFAFAWVSGGAQPMNVRQASFWSANLAGFVVPNPSNQPWLSFMAPLHRQVGKGVGGHEAFLGFVLLGSALVGLVRVRDFWTGLCGVLALAFLTLSLGPTLKIFGTETGLAMPYSFLMTVPPFSMGRTPVRCVLFALFFLTVPAARFLSQIERKSVRGAAIVGVIAVFAGLEMWSPRPLAKVFQSPLDLSRLVPGDVCNIPLTTLDGFAVLLQTQHRRRIVTGLVSRRSEAVANHINGLGDLLDHQPEKFASTLLSWGVTNVILEPGAPDGLETLLPPLGLNVIDLRRSEGRVQ
ncbi:MAG: hypothetical protein ABIP62_01065 [Vicinamibacteria bacterium]